MCDYRDTTHLNTKRKKNYIATGTFKNWYLENKTKSKKQGQNIQRKEIKNKTKKT